MIDSQITRTLFSLLDARPATSTVCPSEVARALMPQPEAAWRALMPDVRRVAEALQAQGLLRVTRGGVPVNATQAGGPIRLGKP